MKKVSVAVFVFVFILNSSYLIHNCLCQWQADVRLTNSNVSSNLYSNNTWCISSNENFVHIVWWENREGNDEIYYKRSTDAGVSWGADTRLTNNSAISSYPSLVVSGSVVHVVWTEYYSKTEIYYKHSVDGGINWSANTKLTNDSAYPYPPSISVSGQVVHIVWQDTRDANLEIYYKRSTDGGINWGFDKRLTNSAGYSESPSIAVSGQVVNVVWYDNRNGNADIFYKLSTDAGLNWGADTRLTNSQSEQLSPSIAVSSSNVHIVWEDFRNGNKEIYYKRSVDGGLNWEQDTQLTINDSNSSSPSIAASGSNVHIVWRDYRDGNYEIYCKLSTDGGVSWGIDTRLTNNPAGSFYPSISISGSNVNIVWEDMRDGNQEIYYKRNPTGNPVGIKQISSEIPNEFRLGQNYPNPFNPMTKIRFDVARHGGSSTSDVKIIVYDAMGREVQTLVNESLQPGTYETTFDGSMLPSGVYFYKLTTDDFSETKRLTLIK